jgi:hypothetical protein
MQDKLSTFRSSRSLRKIRKNAKFEGIFHELGIVIVFHVDGKFTRHYDLHILSTSCQKLKFLHTFGEYPYKFENNVTCLACVTNK